MKETTTDPEWLADQETASLLEDDFGSLPDSPTDSLTVTAFDDLVTGVAPITVVTNPELDGILGAFDQLVIQVVADLVGGVGVTLACQITHSGDGQSYVNKRPVPEITATALSTTGSNILPLGYDDGTLPSLAFVRVKLTLGGTSVVGSRVVCTITGNNLHEVAFTQKTQQYVNQTYAGGCVSMMQGGTKVSIKYNPDGFVANFREPRLTRAVQISGLTAGSFPFQEWFKSSSDPNRTVGPNNEYAWIVWQLKDGYRICFRRNGTLAVLKGVKLVFETQPVLKSFHSNFEWVVATPPKKS
jgi:hypothetical protein